MNDLYILLSIGFMGFGVVVDAITYFNDPVKIQRHLQEFAGASGDIIYSLITEIILCVFISLGAIFYPSASPLTMAFGVMVFTSALYDSRIVEIYIKEGAQA